MERTYSDAEVALILRRAMERQEAGAERREGLALSDVREIAREIGVDPALVTEVAEQLPIAGGVRDARWLGEPQHYEIRLVHDSASTPEQLQELMMLVRSLTQQQGQLREVLGALEWTAVGSVDQLSVTARTQGDRTIVQIVADRGGAAVLGAIGFTAAGLFVASIAGSIIEPGVLGGVALVTSGAASGGVLAWAAWRRGSRRIREKLARLADGIRRALDG